MQYAAKAQMVYILAQYIRSQKLLQALLSNTDPSFNSFSKRRKTNPKQTLRMAKDRLFISVTISKQLWKKKSKKEKNIHTEKLN